MGCGCGKRFSNNSAATRARATPAASANNLSGRQIVDQQAKVVRSQNFAQPAAASAPTTPLRRTV